MEKEKEVKERSGVQCWQTRDRNRHKIVEEGYSSFRWLTASDKPLIIVNQ